VLPRGDRGQTLVTKGDTLSAFVASVRHATDLDPESVTRVLRSATTLSSDRNAIWRKCNAIEAECNAVQGEPWRHR